MNLPKFSVNQSLFVNLVSVIVVIMGLLALFGINREIFPNVAFDVVTITTIYPGAAPADVEKFITVPIERELKQVDGIKEINSSSLLNTSFIYVKIDPDEANKQKVARDIQGAVDRVNDLPRDVDEPVVTELTSRQRPIIEVSLSGGITEHELQKHADTVEDILEDIEGVAKVDKTGYRDREIQILVDAGKMADYYVSLDEIENALAARNISLPAGKIDTESAEYSIRTTAEFLSAKEAGDVIVRSNDSGNWLQIKDVAHVVDTFKDEDIINKTSGTRSINLVVIKKESGDALHIVDQLRKKCAEYSKNYGNGLRISYVNDYSFFARRRLKVLMNNGWVAILLVVGLLLIFLQRDVALMTFVGLPVALFGTFIVIGGMGITINLISMFGLIVVIGMLVDDGIIVSENVYRFMEEGAPPRVAAVKGTQEVMGAVLAAVFTTIAAFTPLLMMRGIIGKFIKNIPVVVIVALLASLVEALIILPCHLADFVKIRKDAQGRPVRLSRDLPWFKRLISFYTRIVEAAIRRKYKIVIGFLAVLAIFIILAFTTMRFILFPNAGINLFYIRAETHIGTPLEKMNELILPIERIVSQLPKEELDTYVTAVGQIQEVRDDPFSGKAGNLAQITVYLTPEQDRKRGVDEIIADLRKRTKDIQGLTDLRFDKPRSGPPVGKPIEARIRGESFDALDEIAKGYIDYLGTIEGASDITWDHKPGKEEIRITINLKKASVAGLDVARIANTIRAVFEGSIATKIKPAKAEEETDVTVRFSKDQTRDISVFEDILVLNKYGNLIPLKKVASIEKVPGTTTIYHLGGKRVVTVSSNVDIKKNTPLKVNRLLERKFKDIPQRYRGYSVKYGGEQEETMDSLKSLFNAFFFAFLIVFLILASFFKSLIQPFIVMLAIPFGLIGVIFAFLVHRLPFSFMAILGIVGLNGIVVNDSIVLVDFINKLRLTGMARKDSIIKAGQMRIRPVILTTVTTVGGLSTVAYGIGGKDPFLVPMALAICWGLSFSTVLTLIIIPCIYSILDDLSLKITKKSSIITSDKIDNGGIG